LSSLSNNKQQNGEANNNNNSSRASKRIYKPIDTYKPSGNLYNHELLKSIQDKAVRK
jgi:hypothetical protein